MAEAISQKIENIIDLSANIVQYSQVKTESEGSFSTLINNATSKVEQTQSNFIEKATKTNTSSINQYAINSEKKQPQSQNNLQIKTNVKKQQQNNINKIDNSNIKTPQNTQKNDEIALKSANNQTVSQIEQSSSSKEQKGFVQTPVSNNSKQPQALSDNTNNENKDINNDSLESSPVLLQGAIDNTTEIESENQNIQIKETLSKKTQDEIKDIIENILLTFDIPTDSNNKNSIDIETIFDSIDATDAQNPQYILKAIDEISSQIDNMDLSKDDKDKIMLALDKLKSGVQTIENNLELDETLKATKNLLDGIILKITQNENAASTIKSNDSAILKEEISSIQKQSELLPDINTEKLEKIVSDIKDIVSELNRTLKTVDKETIKDLSDNINEAISEVEDFIRNIDSDKLLDFNKKLIQALKALSQDIKDSTDNVKLDKNIKIVSDLIDDFKSNIKIQEKQDVKISTDKLEFDTAIKTENFEQDITKIKISDDDTLSEVVSKLKEFEKTQEYKTLDEEDKLKIQETIKKLKLNEDKIVKQDNDEILKDTKKEIISLLSEDIKNSDSEIEISQNIQKETDIKTVDVSSNKNSFSNNKQEQSKANSYKITDMETAKVDNQKTVSDEKNNDNELKIDEAENDIEPEINIKENKENNVQNNKISNSFIKELKEDFLEDISYSNQSPAALTVADEVVKLSLNETSSLKTVAPVGSVTYDPANSAVTIKNVQNIAQVKEMPENNILNQIGDKLYQLKDSQKLTLVLRPNDLGRLSIELTTDKSGLTTNIVAQNEHVRHYIEKNINTLRSQLSEAGVNVNSIQIKTAGQSDASTYEGNQNREFQQEQNQQQQKQNQQQQKQQGKNEFENMQNYDMHFAKDFSSVLNKTLSYMN